MFTTAELYGMRAMMHDSSIPNEHYAAVRSALAKIGAELDRRKLVPASANPYEALAEIGRRVNPEIEARKARRKKEA